MIRSINKKIILFTEIIAAAAYCGGAVTSRNSVISELPLWVRLNNLNISTVIHSPDLDEPADILLDDGIIDIRTESGRYISDSGWVVADCFICDIDHDSYDEVMLHVWKGGSFGEFHPFWLEEEDKSIYSEHLFIYDWDPQRPDRLDPVWMSSAMPVKGEKISVNEKAVISIISPDKRETKWLWEGWGLSLI